MDTVRFVLSPARRARRCILTLLVAVLLGVSVYAAYRADISPLRLLRDRFGTAAAPPTANSQASTPASEPRTHPHS